MSPAPNYIASLDGLRAVSIAIVFFSHALTQLIPGGFGVTVFFFLSGFLITTLLVQEQERYNSISIKAFYQRRVVRLAPPLLVTMLFAIVLVLLGIAEGALDPATITSQVFFYYNYFNLHGGGESSVDGLSVLWSLAVEEHFYLLYPWLFLLLAANRIGLRSIGLILLAVLLWRMVRFYGFGHPEWMIYTSTDTRIDGILYGCFLALLIAKGPAQRWMPDKALYPLIFGGIVLLLVTFVIREDAFRSTIRYSIQGIALIPIFYFATQRSELWMFRPLNWKPVRRVGQYSYTLYLVHSVIIKALEHNDILTGNALLFTLVAGALCLAYSALVFEFVEKPFKPLRQRLTGH